MKRLRLGLAVGGMAVSAAACVALWPHARDAGAILAAQDDPAELSDLQLNSALRNNRAVIEQNIEAALAANDADLANSFVDLAGEKNISLPDELVAAGERCGRRGEFDVAFCQALCQRACDRKCRRCRQHVGHGGRRSVRVRRHQGRGARRQASGDGRGHRSAGAGPCRGGPCGDGGDLCLGRRRGAGARRSHAGQGRPQGRAAGRGADANGPAARRAISSIRRCCRMRSQPAR